MYKDLLDEDKRTSNLERLRQIPGDCYDEAVNFYKQIDDFNKKRTCKLVNYNYGNEIHDTVELSPFDMIQYNDFLERPVLLIGSKFSHDMPRERPSSIHRFMALLEALTIYGELGRIWYNRTEDHYKRCIQKVPALQSPFLSGETKIAKKFNSWRKRHYELIQHASLQSRMPNIPNFKIDVDISPQRKGPLPRVACPLRKLNPFPFLNKSEAILGEGQEEAKQCAIRQQYSHIYTGEPTDLDGSNPGLPLHTENSALFECKYQGRASLGYSANNVEPAYQVTDLIKQFTDQITGMKSLGLSGSVAHKIPEGEAPYEWRLKEAISLFEVHLFKNVLVTKKSGGYEEIFPLGEAFKQKAFAELMKNLMLEAFTQYDLCQARQKPKVDALFPFIRIYLKVALLYRDYTGEDPDIALLPTALKGDKPPYKTMAEIINRWLTNEEAKLNECTSDADRKEIEFSPNERKNLHLHLAATFIYKKKEELTTEELVLLLPHWTQVLFSQKHTDPSFPDSLLLIKTRDYMDKLCRFLQEDPGKLANGAERIGEATLSLLTGKDAEKGTWEVDVDHGFPLLRKTLSGEPDRFWEINFHTGAVLSDEGLLAEGGSLDRSSPSYTRLFQSRKVSFRQIGDTVFLKDSIWGDIEIKKNDLYIRRIETGEEGTKDYFFIPPKQLERILPKALLTDTSCFARMDDSGNLAQMLLCDRTTGGILFTMDARGRIHDVKRKCYLEARLFDYKAAAGRVVRGNFEKIPLPKQLEKVLPKALVTDIFCFAQMDDSGNLVQMLLCDRLTAAVLFRMDNRGNEKGRIFDCKGDCYLKEKIFADKDLQDILNEAISCLSPFEDSEFILIETDDTVLGKDQVERTRLYFPRCKDLVFHSKEITVGPGEERHWVYQKNPDYYIVPPLTQSPLDNLPKEKVPLLSNVPNAIVLKHKKGLKYKFLLPLRGVVEHHEGYKREFKLLNPSNEEWDSKNEKVWGSEEYIEVDWDGGNLALTTESVEGKLLLALNFVAQKEYGRAADFLNALDFGDQLSETSRGCLYTLFCTQNLYKDSSGPARAVALRALCIFTRLYPNDDPTKSIYRVDENTNQKIHLSAASIKGTYLDYLQKFNHVEMHMKLSEEMEMELLTSLDLFGINFTNECEIEDIVDRQVKRINLQRPTKGHHIGERQKQTLQRIFREHFQRFLSGEFNFDTFVKKAMEKSIAYEQFSDSNPNDSLSPRKEEFDQHFINQLHLFNGLQDFYLVQNRKKEICLPIAQQVALLVEELNNANVLGGIDERTQLELIIFCKTQFLKFLKKEKGTTFQIFKNAVKARLLQQFPEGEEICLSFIESLDHFKHFPDNTFVKEFDIPIEAHVETLADDLQNIEKKALREEEKQALIEYCIKEFQHLFQKWRYSNLWGIQEQCKKIFSFPSSERDGRRFCTRFLRQASSQVRYACHRCYLFAQGRGGCTTQSGILGLCLLFILARKKWAL